MELDPFGVEGSISQPIPNPVVFIEIGTTWVVTRSETTFALFHLS